MREQFCCECGLSRNQLSKVNLVTTRFLAKVSFGSFRFAKTKAHQFLGQMDSYSDHFTVVPAPHGDRIEKSGKVLLPGSVLHAVSTKRVVYPLQFTIQTYNNTHTHCGVWEFTATEGQVVMPRWMMHLLTVKAGDPVQMTTAALPKAGLVKLRPREYKFTELHNPRAVLENVMKNFSCISKGDAIPIYHGLETFTMDVMEIKSTSGSNVHAASVIDTDLKVDFERPLDMPASPVRTTAPQEASGFPSGLTFTPQTNFAPPTLGTTPNINSQDAPKEAKAKSAFTGGGRTLSGKPAPPPTSPQTPAEPPVSPVPTAGRTLSGKVVPLQPPPTSPATPAEPATSPASGVVSSPPFTGAGRTLSGKVVPLASPTTSTASNATSTVDSTAATAGSSVKPFAGKGRTLKD